VINYLKQKTNENTPNTKTGIPEKKTNGSWIHKVLPYYLKDALNIHESQKIAVIKAGKLAALDMMTKLKYISIY